ncbi:HAD family hydrolase [Amycolatopsis cihanbeyliensis]|uniref:HAD family hydrolase n=1 Tax=Amycolatopsis cihanbeyliensis TaxID=1128664 RepID=UPI0011545AE4|nr:HAD family phosphatase [Amycolatopsis cihanbeyliensis]
MLNAHDHVLGLLELPDPFTAIIGRDDVGNGKPHPEPYRKGCAALDVPAAETLVFEDAVSGVRSAIAARTRCAGIGVPELREAGAFDVIDDFTGLYVDRSTPAAVTLRGLRPAVPIRR